jgi:Methyltransferase domain/C-methyltransferase C-terminal domain
MASVGIESEVVERMYGQCWACGSDALISIFSVSGIPLSSLILMDSAEQATTFPRGDLELVVCRDCAFIYNRLFDPEAVDYTQPYEESQAFSPRFRVFEQELVDHLVNDYDLAGKEIFEIGCGKASFLEAICRQAGAKGLGIDPSFVSDRISPDSNVSGLREFFDEDHTHLTGDLICSRHTLEHIQPVGRFMSLVRESANHRPLSIVFFEIPDADRILDEGAFWDVYNEHCSYFTLASLSNLFRRTGFEVLRLQRGFDDQYLLIDARLGPIDDSVDQVEVDRIVAKAEQFGVASASAIESWRRLVRDAAAQGSKVVLWGASSKAVGFLSAIASNDAVTAAVDINPFKQDKFLPGSGHPVIGPGALTDIKPDLVIVMNPIYVPEIAETLRGLGLNPEIRALGVEGASYPSEVAG